MMREGNPVTTSRWCMLVAIAFLIVVPESQGFRTWKCKNKGCVKYTTSDESEAVSAEECKLKCLDFAGLWPQPRGQSRIKKNLVPIDAPSINFQRDELPPNMASLLESAQDIFLDRIHQKSRGDEPGDGVGSKMYRLSIRIDIYDPSIRQYTTHTDECYNLFVTTHETEGRVEAKLEANTFFGVRHGLETLSQLIIYDDLHKLYKMIDEAEIKDCPFFTYRGVLLDTARSYIGIPTIKTILDIMAMNKLNTFHWHITDSQSFPYVSEAYPQLSQEGAYSRRQVYTPEAISELVRYALARGIRIIPEFDAPAHVGEGWEALGEDLITCFKWQPWRMYCVEPPCGQFDPTSDRLYDILEIIYKEYVNLFPSDLFHMGGDEVNINCWKSTPRIVQWMMQNNLTINNEGFHKLWILFQEKAYEKLKATRSDPHPKPILWTSTLTDLKDVDKYLSPEEYIIQIWTAKNDSVITKLLKKKYQLIFSNYDELYLDCGGPSWVGSPGSNWCSPYKSWQIVYNHVLDDVAAAAGLQEEKFQQQILGSEAAVWTEQIDESTVLPRLWPRAAALAERLWANPQADWKDVQYRMNYQRQRIGENHPHAELLQPQWCYQNDGYCG